MQTFNMMRNDESTLQRHYKKQHASLSNKYLQDAMQKTTSKRSHAQGTDLKEVAMKFGTTILENQKSVTDIQKHRAEMEVLLEQIYSAEKLVASYDASSEIGQVHDTLVNYFEKVTGSALDTPVPIGTKTFSGVHSHTVNDSTVTIGEDILSKVLSVLDPAAATILAKPDVIKANLVAAGVTKQTVIDVFNLLKADTRAVIHATQLKEEALSCTIEMDEVHKDAASRKAEIQTSHDQFSINRAINKLENEMHHMGSYIS